MDEKFRNYLKVSLKGFLRRRAEEIARAKLKWTYLDNKGELKDEEKINKFMKELENQLDKITDMYIEELEKSGLDSPEKIKENQNKVNEIAKRMEEKIKRRMEEME